MTSPPWSTESTLRMLLPPPLDGLPTPGNRRFHQARARLRKTIRQIIDGYRADGADHGDLLSTLVATRDTVAAGGSDRTGQSLSAEVSDQALTFLFAGTETTATLLTSAKQCIYESVIEIAEQPLRIRASYRRQIGKSAAPIILSHHQLSVLHALEGAD